MRTGLTLTHCVACPFGDVSIVQLRDRGVPVDTEALNRARESREAGEGSEVLITCYGCDMYWIGITHNSTTAIY